MVIAPGGAGQSALAVGLAFSLSKRTRLCAGLEHFFIKANVLFCVPKENQKWFSRWWRGLSFFFWSSGLRSAQARGREGCFDSPLPTSGLHSPRNELRAARP